MTTPMGSLPDEKAHATLRARTVEGLRTYLQQTNYPRLQMTLMVALTSLSGFVASWLMMQLGLVHLGWRYGLAVGIAYLAFLGLLRIWLHCEGRRIQVEGPDGQGIVEGAEMAVEILEDGLPSFRPPSPLPIPPGGTPPAPLLPPGGAAAAQAPGPPTASTGGGGFSLDLDADEALVFILVILALAALASAAFYLVIQAPAILADLLFDGVLGAGLYRRLKTIRGRTGEACEDGPSWLSTALRKTGLPFLFVALFVTAAGWAMHHYAPEARSIGGVWVHYQIRAGAASGS